MKFLQGLIAIILLVLLIVWGVGRYLGPDDLGNCTDLRPTSEGKCTTADAIVAISGGDTNARADEAIRLYKKGWAPLIIFSGAAADKSGPSNASVMRQQAIESGVEPANIIIEENSETTNENALETSSIFSRRNISSAILVTSGYHQRRAMLEFNRRALDVSVRSHPVANDKHWGPFWWMTPTGWALAIPEVIRSLVLSTGGVDRS